ncbi:ETX/MTX2 family pore-forming toxin [Paenibacillus melissococcoides]|uniref:ETX/MTX2 family pore-forming toxin n=1 Tax=Paenibacillus melissococcoides TaxID=2912268 RepID=A0ABM9G954_9BACL|nr:MULTISPECIES: ETX/MTX2 family pore-forming toxin [Paenibacillus]MEB9894037.1 ETX/MTX2 family pore-forming toxin [Bacillus cereus]CAH8247761.1 ETX/MTX2 family pore-forming toxin [Paenibacillus melissococcoides]CAH8719619.1 ETX/MTX2 family pore-forming toxin [Paenibacillus melissococcoides]CAH8720616.1 ETX/MTX2 family pore-forming toxin [Paenibacillus melissococcoides]
MKIRFKQKKLSLMTLGIVLGLSSTMLFGSNAMAAANITDVDAQMDKICEFYYNIQLDGKYLPDSPGAYHYLRLNSSKTDMDLDLQASGVKNLRYSDLSPEYIGENLLDNRHIDVDQTMTTSPYSHQYTNSVSTSVSEGFKVGGKSTIFKLPILLTGGVDISAEFNSATSTTQTVSDVRTITAPSQNIKVPAGKAYWVKVDLTKKSFGGDVDFTATGKNVKSTLNMLATYSGPGFPRPNKYPSLTFATADMWKKIPDPFKPLVFPNVKFDSNNNLVLNGKAKVEGIFGSKLLVTVYDVTDIADDIKSGKLTDDDIINWINGIHPRSAENHRVMSVVSQKFIDLE